MRTGDRLSGTIRRDHQSVSVNGVCLCDFHQLLTNMSMRVLVACKRVIDYAVKVTLYIFRYLYIS